MNLEMEHDVTLQHIQHELLIIIMVINLLTVAVIINSCQRN